MISDKLLKKLEKTVSKMDMNRLSEISIMQGQDGSYFLFNKYTIKKSVKPKQGRVAIFDGRYYHTANQPNKDIRCVINYNLV